MHGALVLLAVEYVLGFAFTALRLGRDWRGHRIHTPPGRKRRWHDTHWGAPFACTFACLLWPLSVGRVLWEDYR